MKNSESKNMNSILLKSRGKVFSKGMQARPKPSDLLKQQTNGSINEEMFKKPKIIQYQNLSDYSSNTNSKVNIDEPLFEPLPGLIQFNDYEPLQIKEKKFRLRNKDKFARRVKIIQPDSRLFQVIPANAAQIKKQSKDSMNDVFSGNKVAPGMEIQFIIRFSPEAKIDYNYDLIVETEREKFIVPIRAVGKRAMIDFPDSLDFENAPVKYVTEKPVIIRNLGEKTSKWLLQLPSGFDADKKEGVLEYGKNEQIVIKFYPTEAKVYKNEAILKYDGLEAYIPVTGRAHNGNVYLSKTYIQMDESYIGLQTQQTLQIINKSEVKVDFQWRAFKTEKEEQEKKNKLRLQLEQEEAEEKMLLKEIVSNEIVREEIDIDDQEDSDEEEKDEKTLILKRQKKAELLLSMKYKNIEKAIDDDMLLFQDDIFSIEPIQGQIWPHSEMTITITFQPKLALHYSCTSFCNISFSDQRLSLHLAGEGIGPRAILSATDINIGDIYVGEEKKETILIENRGEIKAQFELMNNDTPFGKMFNFGLDKGILEVGQRKPFEWTFKSSILGEFSETFRWKLDGSSDMLPILFTGHVLAPKFQFTPNFIDFGKASYSFPLPRTIKLENKSTVPFKFHLRIPGDGKLSQKEFEIKPSKDILPAKSHVLIEVIFIPLIPKSYDMVMVIDLEGIGQDMYSLPIKGVCEVPNVKIEPLYEIKFGDIFLRNPDNTEITLYNDSHLKARYEVLPQNEETKILAEYSLDHEQGVIEPNQRVVLNMTLITKKLGEISLPLAINIVGNSQNNPHIINITATSIGPIVEVATRELDFGQVQVLENKSMFVKIKNKSSIEADFHAFTKKKPSPFKPIQKHGVLKPEEEMNIEIVCNADEAARLQDTLHFVIKEGVDVDVQLKARSVGHTIFWKENLDNINFGIIYTHRSKIHNILIENKGNKSQMLTWAKKDDRKQNNQKAIENGDADSKAKKNNNASNRNRQQVEEEEEEVFQIIPDKIELPAKSGYIFQFKGFSQSKGKKCSKFILSTTIGKERKTTPLITANLEGMFIIPNLVFSEQRINFQYEWEKDIPIMAISKILEMTCGSQLPTNFSVKVDPPFNISQEQFELQSGQTTQVRIDFDPSYRIDRISGERKSKLQIVHNEHPHKESVDLIGKLCFPNLKFDTQQVNFGAILVETHKKIVVQMKNESIMPLIYEWSFLDEDFQQQSSQQNKLQINEIFDILPLSGKLEPGECENVEFIFYAILPQKFKTTAICHVEGGPDYEVQLQGDSSNQDYRLSTTTIEVGDVKFNDWVSKDIYLENIGKVNFEFRVYLQNIIRKGLIEVNPMQGRIQGGEKQRFTVKVCPGFPDVIQESFQIECGYFEPQNINIYGKGIFPSILTNLQRQSISSFSEDFQSERKKRSEEEQKHIENYMNQLDKKRERELEGDKTQYSKVVKNTEVIVQEIEQECDRKQLCSLIMENIQAQNQLSQQQNQQTITSEVRDNKDYQKYFDKIILSSFVLDFGNIVLNSNPKKKVFKVFNSGNMQCDILFDSKVFKQAGYTFNPERIQKLAKGQSQNVVVTYTSKKTKNFGKNKIIVPMDIKNGPKYQIELINNLTYPEITIETDQIDFGKVLVNQKKTVFVRFSNDREVDCNWEIRKIGLNPQEKKDEQKFMINPSSGVIGSQQKQTIEFSFIPTSDKAYSYRFMIGIQDNSKPLSINVKGQGCQVQLEYSPETINIGPVLPYHNFSYALLNVHNPTEFDTELYSLDFDQQYQKEEKQLLEFEDFKTQEPIFMPVRNPGQPFWDVIVQENLKKEKMIQLENQIQEIIGRLKVMSEKQNNEDQQQEQQEEQGMNEQQLQEEKMNLQKQLDELKQQERITKFPMKVDDDKLHHVILFGPTGVGKTQLARQLNKQHKRCIINMNELLEWNINNNTDASKLAQEHLAKLQEEYELMLGEREKALKKAGKKAQQLEEQLGPVDEKIYKYLTDDIYQQLLEQRMQYQDCNAGVIFDNLSSENYPNELNGLKIILKTIKQSIQMIVLKYTYDKNGLEIVKPIEWEMMEKQYQERKKTPQNKMFINRSQKQTAKSTNQQQVQQQQTRNPTEEEALLEQQLFDIFVPRQFQSDQEKQDYEVRLKKYQDMVYGNVEDIDLNEISIPVPQPFENPEEKEKEKKADKKQQQQQQQQQQDEQELEQQRLEQQQQARKELKESIYIEGKRLFNFVDIQMNINQLLKQSCNLIPAPIYPDPNLLPVPEPIFQQVIYKPNGRKQKKNAPQNYKILTPVNMLKKEETKQQKNSKKEKEEKEKEKEKDNVSVADKSQENDLELEQSSIEKQELSKMNSNNEIDNNIDIDNQDFEAKKNEEEEEADAEPEVVEEQQFDFEKEELQENIDRWIIPSKRTLQLVVKFFTKQTGVYEDQLEFENFYGLKKHVLKLVSKSDFPNILQNPKNLYWNVRKIKMPNPPECYVSKKFIIQDNFYDFGPLLINKNPNNRHDAAVKNINSDTFKITNSGKFDCELEFSFSSNVIQNEEYKQGIFKVEPETMSLKANDQQQEIRVWAFPNEVQTFRDDLIIMIKDNPLPVILPLKCLGQKPVMEIIEGDGLQFDRLLLNQSSKQQIVLKNVSAIPLKWNLSGLDQLPSEFVIINTEGELQPSKETIVEVQFKAIQQMKFSQKLYLEVQDIENMDIKQEPRPISIDAEAFDISVQFKFPNDALSDINQNSDSMQQENNLLDFGSVRVGEIKEQTFTIKNNGLYKVKYNFKMNKKLFRECFQIEPNESELEPGMEKIVAVRFLSKNQEIKLKTANNTTDIVMEILEGKTQELFKPVPINVNVNSVYSKYSITPLKKINFGPIMFSENKQRTFEIKNEGIFEFNFNIFDYFNEETRQQIKEQNKKEMEERMQLQQTDKGKGKGAPNQQKQAAAKGKDAKGSNQQQLKVGQYVIQPFQGSIQPDQSQVVEVIFQGQNQQIYEQKLAIDVSCRDPADEPEGILYEMIGESCIPGICTENYQAIFEEQVVIPSLQSTGSIAGVVNSNIFSIEEKIFFFGTLVPSKVPDGIEEKFKIINPNKVQCTVKFDVRKRNNNQMEQFGFEVFPKQVKISPHEHTYVKVLFKPTIMATYSGIFEALVEQGEQNPKTQKLVFDLRGEGALPTLKLEQPKEYLDERTPIMKFPKLRINKTMVQKILLKNDGQIPATVKIDFTQSNNFRFLSQTSYTLLPKTYQSFQVEFSPRDSGTQQHHIQLTTLLNHYESWKVLLQGEGFYEDISFEGLPNNREDELELGDCFVNVVRKASFMIKNNSKNQVRFNWNLSNLEELSVVPKVGHIQAQSTKTITLQFLSQKSIQFTNQQIQLEYKHIEQTGGKFTDWDDSMTTVRYISQREKDYLEQKKEEERIRKEQELANQQKGKKAAAQQQQQINKEETQFVPDDNDVQDIAYEEPVVEPEFNPIQQQDKNIPLKVNCVCDLVRYECEVQQIFFKPTMMFTNRIYQFKLRNTSNITMKYDNKLCTDVDQLWDPGYFSIMPKQGTIKSNCDEVFTVKFSPTEVEPNNYRLLQIQMDNLDPQQQELTIDIDGESDRPICHFELPPTNIKSEKDNIKIFEFESLGIKIRNTKRFYIVNPTSTGYEFEWTKVEEEKNPNNNNTGNYNYFRCVTQKGVVLSGKKFEMIFEYQPEQFGNHIVYYMFSIPEFKLEQQFMIHGSVKEPKVFLDVGKVNFGPLLLGGKNKEVVHLKNLEDVPIQFSFDKQSIKGEPEYNNSLQIKPISGVVKPENEIPIEIMFYPQNEIQYNYNLSCNVQRKSQPLNLNVKGIGYILHHQVNLEGYSSALSPQDLTVLNFEDIFINEKRVKRLTIENKGDFNFDYSIKRSAHVSLINIKPENGTVRKHEKVVVEVTFAPSNNEHKFKGKASRLSLQIISGPTYHFDIKGSSRKPNVELSFMEYNFGPSFVLKRPLPVQTILELKNKDKQAMSLEANFEKTNYLDIQLANGQVLLPYNNNNNILKVPIVFTPRDIMKYEETIQLDINNLHKMELKVMGEGIPFKIDLDKQEDQVINFGTVKTGQDITKTIYIVNHSKKAINITFDNENQLQDLKENYLYITPNKNMKIMPKEKREVEIRFNPQIRLHKFNQELFYKIVENNEPRKLLNIEGICHGLELKLMEDTLGFGPVVINSKLTKHLQLANLGDIGAYFQWDTVFCKQFFTINPKQGFISPHEDVNFEVTFHPNVVDNDIRFNKVKCNIENQNPLYITLLGKCVAQPKEQIQQLTFETMVRQQTKQKIQLKNPTNQIWKIKSTITIMNQNYQSYFYGNEYIEVPANGSADYEINYYPLTMTAHPDQPQIKEQQHDGSIFFPLPDGSAIVYDLIGKSLPPSPVQLENTQFKAKTNGQYVIKVQNWLKETQRFNVELSLENTDPSIFVNAANTIDIMGEGTKDYKLIVFSLKANSNTLVITFTNSQTFEYMQYKLPLTFNGPDILSNIELSSVVRESVSKLITIENPLPQQVSIKSDQFVSDNDNISFNPSNFTIPAKSEFGFEVNYRPLIAGDFQSKFSLKSPELGDFTYQLQLKGIQNTSQKQLIFKTALATEIVQTFKFYNYLKKPATYQVKIDKLGSQIKQSKDAKIPAIDFSLENPAQANIQAAATDSFEGLEVPINIRFEPSSLLESKALLTVSNQEGGEYQCILVGHSLSPQPKGPFKITGAKPPPIEFKNPFFEAMEFTIRIDNPSFTANVKSPIKIDAKKNISISLTYKAVPGSTNNGRLTISTEDMPSWVFYLQGE